MPQPQPVPTLLRLLELLPTFARNRLKHTSPQLSEYFATSKGQLILAYDTRNRQIENSQGTQTLIGPEILTIATQLLRIYS